jgi:hypothetical protein
LMKYLPEGDRTTLAKLRGETPGRAVVRRRIRGRAVGMVRS